MIGQPEWFTRRKYGGWGLHPKTWQGWVYIALMMIPFVVFQALPYWDNQTRVYVTIGWLLFLGIDVLHVMSRLKKDEMEFRIEAIAERNAAWVMVGVLVAGILFQLIESSLRQQPEVNPFIVAALFGGVLTKAISNAVLERRGV